LKLPQKWESEAKPDSSAITSSVSRLPVESKFSIAYSVQGNPVKAPVAVWARVSENPPTDLPVKPPAGIHYQQNFLHAVRD